MAKKIRTLFLFCIVTALIVTCKKNNIEATTTGQPAGEQVDLSAKVTTSVSGFVTNESNTAVEGANVQYGESTTSTDKYGYFEIKNATVVQQAAFVTVNMNGYFKGIKTFVAEEGKHNFCRIKLIPKTISGSVNASAGGNITLSNGLNISIPENVIMDATTKSMYNGTVNAAMFWINPLDQEINSRMPGDLRGINNSGLMDGLLTYGMAAVELTGDNGELLQVAEGKKVNLTMPIPTSIATNAPSTIPLWYFDETNGLWKEDGYATKSGNNYIGEVGHFSFWNCDIPVPNRVNFNCTFVDTAGHPLNGASVMITLNDNPIGAAHGYTNENGYISGSIPANAALLLEVFDDGACAVYSQHFMTSSASYSFGTIQLPATNTIIVSGTVTDCNSNPATNGYIILKKGNNSYFYGLNGNTFSFPVTNACSTTTISITAINSNTAEESLPENYTIAHQNINLPNIVACGITATEYSNLTIDGESYILGPYSGGQFMTGGNWFPNPVPYSDGNSTLVKLINGVYVRNDDHIQWSMLHSQTPVSLNNLNYIRYFDLYRGADYGYTQILYLRPIGTTSNPINITEYGNAGEFIAGNFSGILYEGMYYPNPDSTHPHLVTYNFRMRRGQ